MVVKSIAASTSQWAFKKVFQVDFMRRLEAGPCRGYAGCCRRWYPRCRDPSSPAHSPRLRREFVYLAVLMDVFTRAIRGWHLGRSLDQGLTLAALERAWVVAVAARAARRSRLVRFSLSRCSPFDIQIKIRLRLVQTKVFVGGRIMSHRSYRPSIEKLEDRRLLSLTPPYLLPGDASPTAVAGTQYEPEIAHGADKSLVVWTDNRSSLQDVWLSHTKFDEELGSMHDIYAARLDASGAVIDTTPIIISQGQHYQTWPHVAWNGRTGSSLGQPSVKAIPTQ